MLTSKYTNRALLIVIALCIAATLNVDVADGIVVYNYKIYTCTTPSGDIYARVPQNSSAVGINTTITITAYANTTGFTIKGWGDVIEVEPNVMRDYTLKTASGSALLQIFYHSTPLLNLTYRMVSYMVVANDPNLQPAIDDELDRVRREAEPPTLWLWSPFTWGGSVLLIVLIAAIFGFGFTRTTLLIDWLNQANMIFACLVILLILSNFIYMIVTTGDTAVDSLLGFAYMMFRMLLIASISFGWFAGVGFARYSLDLQKYWVVNMKKKTVSETNGVVYKIKGKDYWAHQTLWDAINRLFRDIHTEINYKHDRSIAKKGWTFVSDFGSSALTLLNGFFSDRLRNTVMLDMSGDISVRASFREVKPGPDGKPKAVQKIVVIEGEFSNIARVMGCELPTKLPRDFEDHCCVEDAILHMYYLLLDNNRKLTQEILVVRNKEVKKYIDVLNNNILDLAHGKATPDDREKLLAEVQKAINGNANETKAIEKQERKQLDFTTVDGDEENE